jgi:amino acid transporter
MEKPDRRAITIGFNVLLFLYYLYAASVSVLFEPDMDARVLMDDLYDVAPLASLVVAVVLGVILVLAGALVIRAFWNRLVTCLFSIRKVNYQESLAIILMYYIFVGEL